MKSLEVQKPFEKIVFHQKLFFSVGNLNHPKLGNIIFTLFDFQGNPKPST